MIFSRSFVFTPIFSAIQYALNLYQYHEIPLTQAYARAVAQFRSLRSEHHIATTFAVMESEQLGAVFVGTEIERGFEKERESLNTWQKQTELDEGELLARKRWKAIAEKHSGAVEWSKGQEYVRLWKEGVRPDYSPALTMPVLESSPSVQAERASGADFMAIGKK